jgi:HEAT repeat protein
MPGLQRLLTTLGDPNPQVRCTAAQALQQIADPAQLPHFFALLQDEHFEVRLAAIQGLRRFSDPAITSALVAHLVDKDSDVRRAAAQALGSVQDPAALEPLVLLLADEEPAVRHAAAAALEEINPRWVRTDALQRAIPGLEARRRDPQPWIAAAAEKALQKICAAKGSDTQLWNRESGIRNL